MKKCYRSEENFMGSYRKNPRLTRLCEKKVWKSNIQEKSQREDIIKKGSNILRSGRKLMRLLTLMLLQVKQTMTSLYCYDNSNVNVILAITNFHLYLTPPCDRFPVPLWKDMLLMPTNKQKSDLFLITNKTEKRTTSWNGHHWLVPVIF